MKNDPELSKWIEQLLGNIKGEADIDVLDSLQQCYINLLDHAETEEEIGHAFRPLLFARCIFSSNRAPLKRRPPSEIRRALISEYKAGWRSFERPRGTQGRTPGTPNTTAGVWLNGVISRLTQNMPLQQRERFFDWLLAPGNAWVPGYECAPAGVQAGAPSPAQDIFVNALKEILVENGLPDKKIQEMTTQLRAAFDNLRRNRRARTKK